MGIISLHHSALVTSLWTLCIKLTENRVLKEKTQWLVTEQDTQ